MPENHIERVDDTGDVSEQGQEDVKPEVPFEPDLEKHTHRRQ